MFPLKFPRSDLNDETARWCDVNSWAVRARVHLPFSLYGRLHEGVAHWCDVNDVPAVGSVPFPRSTLERSRDLYFSP